MAVRDIDPADARALTRFVRMERELLGSEPLYWSDTESDVRKRLSGRSAFSKGTELRLFTADGSARCAAIVNRRWQAEREPDTAFIGYFAAAPGAELGVVEMLAAAEEWLASMGARRVIAPVNGSGMLGMGVLTDAFDESPMFPLPWNPSYYPAHLEAAGYAKAYPLYVYEVDLRSPEYARTARSGIDDAQCDVRQIDKRRWREELDLYRRLFNAGFRDEWEMHEYERAEFEELYLPLKPVVDPRLILFAELDGEPVGICSGFPDWTPLFRSFRGRFGPLQAIRFLHGARRIERAGLVTIALAPGHRGRRVGRTLAAHLFRTFEELGLDRPPYYLVNEVNSASRGLAKSFGAEERLLYHCYDKRLD
jgi:GNAT superfamily N-acetyltransferase